MDNPEDIVPTSEGHVQISATDDDLKGRYANLMSVSHTAEGIRLRLLLGHTGG